PAESDKVRLQFLKAEKPPGITSNVTDLSYLDGVEQCDKIIYSVTAARNLEQKFGAASDFWRKATTIQHIFFENVKSKNLIGVTGSKGKGTTSTLIFEMLKAALRHSSGPAGPNVYLAGNIGTSVLDILGDVKESDWVVLEVTNFQLYKFPYSPHIAVILKISEEHLDWHPNMADYIGAKSNITKHQSKDDIAVYMASNPGSKEIAGYSPGKKIPYGMEPGAFVRADGTIVVGTEEIEVIKTNELKLIGEHNHQNVCAAVTTVMQITQNLDAIRQVLRSFSGLEHRLKLVRELDHIQYFDDSFGTNPDTAIVAIRAFAQPIILILGGSDKGASYEGLVAEIVTKDRVRHVITIGQTGPKIAELLRGKHFMAITEGLEKMPDIVAEARRRAQPGDVVLLSTASASFGLFKDYKDRGNQFKAAVDSLN
ncbi:UDP-N-acetylmuramoyl-L-alanine--D-glutamate ligase, partial [bacterium G20]